MPSVLEMCLEGTTDLLLLRNNEGSIIALHSTN